VSGVADVTGTHAACTAYIASDSAAAGFTVSLTMATAAANQRHLLHRSPRAFVRLSVARKEAAFTLVPAPGGSCLERNEG